MKHLFSSGLSTHRVCNIALILQKLFKVSPWTKSLANNKKKLDRAAKMHLFQNWEWLCFCSIYTSVYHELKTQTHGYIQKHPSMSVDYLHAWEQACKQAFIGLTAWLNCPLHIPCYLCFQGSKTAQAVKSSWTFRYKISLHLNTENKKLQPKVCMDTMKQINHIT